MNPKIFVLLVLVSCFVAITVSAQKRRAAPAPAKTEIAEPQFAVETSPQLQSLVNRAAGEAVNKYSAKGLNDDNLAVTLIDLRDPANLKQGEFHGEFQIYPASVVKLFYLAAAHRWLADGKIKDSPELQRGLRDMIVDSSNDATHYIVDIVTGAPGGGELAPVELEQWAFKRNAVNRYFSSLGYQNINVNQKTYCEDIYGRERQYWDKGKFRNKLTTNATARLMAEIALGKAVSAERSKQMMELLKRDQFKETADKDSQDTGFTGIALKTPGTKLWSKAGWTSRSRHDAAYVETPDGLKFVLVTFTEGVANEREIIADITRAVLEGMKTIAK